IIFLVTLFTTLFTNLITGIGMGILVTFILHVLVNKSVFLFVNHLLKPNILMFKEKDANNYYISVKYFCSFLNFYKLKNKLDVIPEDQNVILDFSMCSFVDHTVMEGLDNYIETFSSKEGSIEIIGLDKHGAASKHPFAIRKVIPFANIVSIGKYFTKRQSLLKTTSQELKWSYLPKRNKNTQFLTDFLFFKNRKIPYIYNRIFDKLNTYMVFDAEFTEGEFTAKEVVKTTLLHIRFRHKIPVFTLDKEGLLNFVYGLSGFKDIDIDNHPDFNKRFYLSGENKVEIQQLFTDELILFIESNAYYHVESNGTSLIILKKERLLSVQEIKAMLYFGKQLTSLLQQNL
ncbi:unnamed protein product, partial [Ectocarpus sp. 12 AP-2014]